MFFACFLVAFTICPHVSKAGDPLPKLAVTRSEDALDCPDAKALSDAVSRHLKRDALDPTPGTSQSGILNVEIKGGPHDYTAVLKAGELSREIHDSWKDCSGLAEALPLAIAILLDDEHVSLSPAPTAPAPESSEARPAEPLPSAPAPAPPRPAPPPSEAAPLHRQITSFYLELGGVLTSGWLGPAVPGAAGFASLRISRFTLELGGLALASQTLQKAPGTVDVSLAAAHLGGCARVLGTPSGLHLNGCAETKLGMLTGQGHGYAENREANRPWFSLGGALSARMPLFQFVGLSARAGILVLPVVQRFSVEERTLGQTRQTLVFDPPRAGFFVCAGLTLKIW